MALLERDDDLELLDAHWARARGGHGSLVIVAGEPGAGKSSLLQAFVATVDADADDIVWGACDPLPTPRPLGPLHDVAGQLGDATRHALRDASQSHEIFAAVHARLCERPTVLVVDDLHWADQGTIDLLRYLLRRVADTSALVLATVRDEEIDASHAVRALLGDVARSADATSIAVHPLSRAAIARMIETRSLDPARIEQLTGGNPFFVTAMLDHEGDELPTSVRDAILARTTHLDDRAWDVLHLLACAPEAIADHLLGDLGVGIAALRAVDLAGLIARGARGVAFRHDLCRLAVASTIPPGGEATLHRRMLTALEGVSGTDPAVLTHHAVGAGDRDRVLAYAPAAARAAARSGAHTQAASFYRLALRHGAPADPADEAALLEAMAIECYLIDELEQAIGACQRAMALREQAGDSAGVSFNHHSMSVFQYYNANRPVSVRHVEQAIAAVDDAAREPADLVALGHAFAMQAFLHIHSSEVDVARRLLGRAAEIAALTGNGPLGIRLGVIGGVWSVVTGEPDGRRAMLEVLAGALDEFDEIYSTGYSNLSYLDVEQRRLSEAAELLEVSLPLTIERDLPICYAWQRGTRGRLQLLEGDWNGALDDADGVLGDGFSAPMAHTWPLLIRGLIAMRRAGTGRTDLDAAWQLATRYGEPIRMFPASAALAEQMWLTGDDDDRAETWRRLFAEVGDRPGLEWARGELAIWLQRVDTEFDHRSAAGVAEPYQLMLEGRHTEAAALWEQLSAPYEQALALASSDSPDDARQALDILDRLGADAVAAKLRLDLRNRGISAVPSRRRASTLSNPFGLTAREVDVLRLLDQRLTNAELADRLYISTKTADHHVSAILSKLGVANRREAATRARQLNLV
jgi:DNA-binding CsgD family transcriptional regulator